MPKLLTKVSVSTILFERVGPIGPTLSKSMWKPKKCFIYTVEAGRRNHTLSEKIAPIRTESFCQFALH